MEKLRKAESNKLFNKVVTYVQNYCDKFGVQPEDGYESVADYILQNSDHYDSTDLYLAVKDWFEDTQANYPETLIPLREGRRGDLSKRYREEVTAAGATNNGEETPENLLGFKSRKEKESTNWRNDSKSQFAEPGVYSEEGKQVDFFKIKETEEKTKGKVKKLKEALSVSVFAKVLKEDDQFEVNKWKSVPLITKSMVELKIRKEMEGRTVLFGLRVDEKREGVDAYIGPLCFKQNILPEVENLSAEEGAKIVKKLMANIQNNFDEFLSTYYKDITRVLVDYALEDFESKVH